MNFKKAFNQVMVALLSFAIAGGPALAARTTTYFHTDGAGSVVAATNEAGAVLWRKDYAPFGAQLNSPPNAERTSYTGKQHDEAIGLTYFGARWFDPETARFTGVDPVGFNNRSTMTFNRYQYAYDNPYKFVDPDGRVVWFIAIFAIAALMASDAANAPTPTTVTEPIGGANRFASGFLLPGAALAFRATAARQAIRAEVAATGTQLGYHATRVENVGSILTNGLRSSVGGRAGSGVYVSSSAEGAMAEFAAHSPGVTPALLQVGYTPGTNYFLQGLTRSYVQGPIPLAADTIGFGSVRLPGAINTVIRNESATVLGVMPK